MIRGLSYRLIIVLISENSLLRYGRYTLYSDDALTELIISLVRSLELHAVHVTLLTISMRFNIIQ